MKKQDKSTRTFFAMKNEDQTTKITTNKRISESLRLCAEVPTRCGECVETFGIGCATRLKYRAADMIDALSKEDGG